MLAGASTLFGGTSKGIPPLKLEQVPAEIYITRGVCTPRTVFVPDACPSAMLRSTPWCVEDFQLHKQLYKGKASLLYSATCRISGRPIALKLYRKDKLSNLNWFQVEREIRIHSQLNHNNIIQLFASFEDAENVYLAQEFASGGDLYEDLKGHGGRIEEERVARSIISPCMEALSYLHKLGVIHRDIKSENILLMGDGTVKLADFGLSINHREERPVTRAGTLDMMAPEVLVCPEKSRPEENKDRGMLEYTDAVDAWAIGIVAFELLVGHPPFERESRSETYEHIMYRAPFMPAVISEGAKSFITSALVKAVSKRPSVEQLLSHPWLRSHQQLLHEPAAERPSIPKKMDLEAGSVNITIDCRLGSGQHSSAGSNVSSSGSVEAQTGRAHHVEDARPSVFQWAGSSLKTITKKLRKPSVNSPSEAGRHSQAPPGPTFSKEAATSDRLPPDMACKPAHLQISAAIPDQSGHQEMEEQQARIAPQGTPPVAVSEHAGAPNQLSGLRQSRLSGMASSPVASAIPRQPSVSRVAPSARPQLSHSLASLVLGSGEEASAEAAQRRSLLTTQHGLEINPPSPPAYLTRPWLHSLPKLSTEAPSSPTLHSLSPLARRRRRMAGQVDSSSSGSMNLADTPKGGHFPSGSSSARSFGRAALRTPGSPSKWSAAEASAKSIRSHHSALFSRNSQWATTQTSPDRRLESATLPRKLSSSLRGPLSRAASATPASLPVARKLSLDVARGATAQAWERKKSATNVIGHADNGLMQQQPPQT